MSGALAVLLAVAVLAAAARLVVRWARTPAGARAAPWRLALLVALPAVAAVVLYLALTPRGEEAGGTLVVATRGAGVASIAAAERVVALPEAPRLLGAERVPDLATALRRFRPVRLRIVGAGLGERDRAAAHGLRIAFDPPPPPAGLVRLDPPGAVATGAAFRVGGRVAGLARPAVDLLDPAGRRVDTATVAGAGDFVVGGAARAAGPAQFIVRVRDGGQVVETAIVPVWTGAAVSQRMILRGGAPGPEVKYLRRWAADAGVAVAAEIATGAGIDLGDVPLPMTAATLARVDLAVFDARSWAALSAAERAEVIAAVDAGLGLIVRLDGPVADPLRAALRPLGFAVGGGGELAPFVLPPSAIDDTARLARAGPGSADAPATINRDATAPPLARWTAAIAAPDATALVRDARGSTVAPWRALGRGRVALWPLADSYGLVLAGRGDLYAELWSTAFAVVGRARGGVAPTVVGVARAGERATVCGVDAGATVVGPDGRRAGLVVDPATGPARCAGFWPTTAGWHRIDGAGGTATPVFAYDAAALPGVRAAADRAATLALATGRPAAGPAARIIGRWPWFAAWLVVSGSLWWFERTRFGLPRPRAGP